MSNTSRATRFPKTLKNSRKTIVVLVAIALIPLIYAGALTWANKDPMQNLNQVPAAVVNLDGAATVGDSEINLGKNLTTQLVDGDAPNNFNWREMDESEATKALESGSVLAVITIPEDFSAAAEEGASRLADGTGEAVSGANTLVAGLNELAEGSSAVHSGALELATGAAELKAGASTIATQVETASDAARELKSSVQGFAEGSYILVGASHELATNLSNILTNYDEMNDEGRKAALQQLNAGAAEITAGLEASSPVLNQILSGADLLAGNETTGTGLVGLTTGAKILSVQSSPRGPIRFPPTQVMKHQS